MLTQYTMDELEFLFLRFWFPLAIEVIGEIIGCNFKTSSARKIPDDLNEIRIRECSNIENMLYQLTQNLKPKQIFNETLKLNLVRLCFYIVSKYLLNGLMIQFLTKFNYIPLKFSAKAEFAKNVICKKSIFHIVKYKFQLLISILNLKTTLKITPFSVFFD